MYGQVFADLTLTWRRIGGEKGDRKGQATAKAEAKTNESALIATKQPRRDQDNMSQGRNAMTRRKLICCDNWQIWGLNQLNQDKKEGNRTTNKGWDPTNSV
jgi:predicted DNA-binding WGR domain protein